jgi:hypothetical protein
LSSLGKQGGDSNSSKDAPFNVAIRSDKEGTKGGKKRCKQRPQGAMTTTDCDNDNNGKADGSGMGRIASAAHSNEHHPRLPTDNFKRLLEEACPNHV